MSSCNIADQNNWSSWDTNPNQTIRGFCANLMFMAVYTVAFDKRETTLSIYICI